MTVTVSVVVNLSVSTERKDEGPFSDPLLSNVLNIFRGNVLKQEEVDLAAFLLISLGSDAYTDQEWHSFPSIGQISRMTRARQSFPVFSS